MNKYQSICIKDAMSNIATNLYLLPAIQRKFVWSSDQIEMLFDSILRNYPINSFMLWKITDNEIKTGYKFYSFIKDYAQKFHEDNPDASSALINNDFYAVIDGQQRLTSLYIGLNGSYREKRLNKWWKDNEDSLPTKRLYLELSSPIMSGIDNAKEFNFRFLTDKQKKEDLETNTGHYWFRVGDILKFKDLSDVNQYLIDNGLFTNRFSMSALANLFNKVSTEELINYYTVEEQDQDKVLDVFIRTNSGGTPLSFSDLLMSIASANWTQFDARDEMRKTKDEIYSFGNPNFIVSQDFILKAILVLSDVDLRFKIQNFCKSNITMFEKKWSDIKKSLVSTFQLLEELGFNDSLLRAKNAAIPVAYYIYKKGIADEIVKSTYSKDDKTKIAKWLAMALLKGMFGGTSDNVLKTLREIIGKNYVDGFPIEKIINEFKGNVDKNYSFDDVMVGSFLEEQYGSPTCGLVLMLLYPTVVLEHGKAVNEDHMHPKTMFIDEHKLDSLGLSENDKPFYEDEKNFNSVLNLQLLEHLENISKGDTPLADWAKNKKKTSGDLFVNEDTDLGLLHFKEFIEARRSILSKKLMSILS